MPPPLPQGVGEELYTVAEALEKHYTRARYPGLGLAVYDRRVAERCLRYAEGIRGFVEEVLGGASEGA